MTGRFSSQLALLVDLDLLDQELLELRAELAEVPVDLSARAATLATREAARAAASGRVDDARRDIRDGERDVELAVKRIARATTRLETLAVVSQIEATHREIAQLTEQKDEQEFAVLERMEQLDGLVAALEAATTAVAQLSEALGIIRAAWVAREPVAVARVAALESARSALLPTIDREVLRNYQVGYENRNNRKHRGITRSAEIVCVMCNTEIPVRWVNEARVGDDVRACLGCKRVIVGKAPDADDEDSAG